ncbi:MAG: IS66 family insertion sequence element accessory protein TnpB [Saprospiraceae bacterium]|nr:IS66 family insertion sequence element accessory protein TnpB [Candidatus Vicinibacter affinis]
MIKWCGQVKYGIKSFHGDIYIFFNKRNNQIRMLVYDSGGLVILQAIRKGTFENNKSESLHAKINITWTQLMCIMQGIKLSSIRYKKGIKVLKK